MTDQMTPAEELRRAKALIDAPEKWTKEALGRTAHGMETDGLDPRATQWCAIGAVQHVTRAAWPWELQAINYLAQAVGEFNVGGWNNEPERTHGDVMRAFDAAIALAESTP